MRISEVLYTIWYEIDGWSKEMKSQDGERRNIKGEFKSCNDGDIQLNLQL